VDQPICPDCGVYACGEQLRDCEGGREGGVFS
jgi:hypothetical protein